MNSVKKKILSTILLMGNLVNCKTNALVDDYSPTHLLVDEDVIAMDDNDVSAKNITLITSDDGKIPETVELPCKTMFWLVCSAIMGWATPHLLPPRVSISITNDRLDVSKWKKLDLKSYGETESWGDLMTKFNVAYPGLLNTTPLSENELCSLISHVKWNVREQDPNLMAVPWAPRGVLGPVYVRSLNNVQTCPCDRLPDNDERLSDKGSEIRRYLCNLVKIMCKELRDNKENTPTFLDVVIGLLGIFCDDEPETVSKEKVFEILLKYIKPIIAIGGIFVGLPGESALGRVLPLRLRIPVLKEARDSAILTSSDAKKQLLERRIGTYEVDLMNPEAPVEGISTLTTDVLLKAGTLSRRLWAPYVSGYIKLVGKGLFGPLKNLLSAVRDVLQDKKLATLLTSLKNSSQTIAGEVTENLRGTVFGTTGDLESWLVRTMSETGIPKEFCELVMYFVKDLDSLRVVRELRGLTDQFITDMEKLTN